MPVPTGNTIKLSDICLEIYGSAVTSGKSLLGCHTAATGTFNPTYAVAGNTLLDFRGYTHTAAGVVTSGLVLHLDAGNTSSYPGTGTTWTDLSGAAKHFTLSTASSWDNRGYFKLTDSVNMFRASNLTTSTLGTLVMWIQTADEQALFLNSAFSGGNYVAAYRVGNKEYYGSSGSPNYIQDLVDVPNVYDYIRDLKWHMVEFKNINLSAWTYAKINGYNDYTFGNGTNIGKVMLYDRVLSAAESQQNYDADKDRFSSPTPVATASWAQTLINSHRSRVVADGGKIINEPWLGHYMTTIGETLWNASRTYVSAATGFKETTSKTYPMTVGDTAFSDATLTANILSTTDSKPSFDVNATKIMQVNFDAPTKWPMSIFLNVTWNMTHGEGNQILFKSSPTVEDDNFIFEISPTNYISTYSYFHNEIKKWQGLTPADYINCKILVVMQSTTYALFVNGTKIGTANKSSGFPTMMYTKHPTVQNAAFFAFKGDFHQAQLYNIALSDAQGVALTTR